jgi:hypothetical protein
MVTLAVTVAKVVDDWMQSYLQAVLRRL